MTVMAVEGSAGRAAASRQGGRQAARQRRPTDVEMGRGGPQGSRGQRGSAGTQGPRGPSGRAAAPSAAPEKPRRSQSRRREVAGRLTGASTRPGSTLHNYQAIIAAEYVTATLLVAISPIASRPAQATPTSGKLSPYLPGDIIKIFAIGIVYLILEGMAAGPRGLARFSAWFGFLILIGVGLSELSRLANIFRVLSGGGYQPIQLTGKQAPPVKGGFGIPPLGQGTGTPSKTGGSGG